MRMVKGFHATLPVSVRAPARVTGVHVPNRPDTYRTILHADSNRGVRLYPPFARLSIRVKSLPFQGETGGAPRVTRAPCALKPPSYTTPPAPPAPDRKSTRLNSSHGYISYAVFCLKKKNN